jgi:hypothetical protein
VTPLLATAPAGVAARDAAHAVAAGRMCMAAVWLRGSHCINCTAHCCFTRTPP